MDNSKLMAWNGLCQRVNIRRDTLLAERLQIVPAKSGSAPSRPVTTGLSGFSGLTVEQEAARLKLRSDNALRMAMGFDPLPEPTLPTGYDEFIFEKKLDGVDFQMDFGSRREFQIDPAVLKQCIKVFKNPKVPNMVRKIT